MPSSHHCMAEEGAGIAIQTHARWRYRIITGKTITSASGGDAPRDAHMHALACHRPMRARALRAAAVECEDPPRR